MGIEMRRVVVEREVLTLSHTKYLCMFGESCQRLPYRELLTLRHVIYQYIHTWFCWSRG